MFTYLKYKFAEFYKKISAENMFNNIPDDLSSTFRLYAAIWGIFVTLIGVVGNSLTLLAVTRAIRRKK
jgi:hypothetical protein